MSRGHWGYRNETLKDEIFGYGADKDNVPDVFDDFEISELVFDVFELLYAADSFFSSDISEASFGIEKLRFKQKWFKQSRCKRLEASVDKKLENVKACLLKAIAIEEDVLDGE